MEEAVAALIRIPSHMSYNVTVVDRTGAFKTVRLAPDKEPLVTDAAFTTNHQGYVDWPENAAFNKTLERSAFLEKMLAKKDIDAAKIAASFLKKPLYNNQFKEGFGTLFTAVYRPAEGIVEMRWPREKVSQTFDGFQEQYKLINFEQAATEPAEIYKEEPLRAESFLSENITFEHENSTELDWQESLADTLVRAMSQAKPSIDKKQLDNLRGQLYKKDQLSWEVLANFWTKSGKGYETYWNN